MVIAKKIIGMNFGMVTVVRNSFKNLSHEKVLLHPGSGSSPYSLYDRPGTE